MGCPAMANLLRMLSPPSGPCDRCPAEIANPSASHIRYRNIASVPPGRRAAWSAGLLRAVRRAFEAILRVRAEDDVFEHAGAGVRAGGREGDGLHVEVGHRVLFGEVVFAAFDLIRAHPHTVAPGGVTVAD